MNKKSISMKKYNVINIREDGSSAVLVWFLEYPDAVSYIKLYRPPFELFKIEKISDEFLMLEIMPPRGPHIVVDCLENDVVFEKRWFGMSTLSWDRYGGRYIYFGPSLE